MRTKFNGFLALLLALVVQISFAQEKNITGTVVDETGMPLLGATVLVIKSDRGTSTDFDGNFSIQASEGEKVEVSYIGYQSSTFTVGSSNHYDVILKDGDMIDEVVLVGYGSGRNISQVTGSIASVQSDKLSNKPVANVMEALQGQVAGLQLFTSSGEPTALSTMRLHGIGSVTASNQPLFVLDGVPIDSQTLLTLNSNDFESVTVLKDAAATSIYGSRAANGVIYITSKKGEAGNSQFSLNYEYGFSELARKNQMDLMDAKQLLDFQLDKGFINQDFYDERIASGINTNWESYYYRDNAPVRKVDMAMSGGNENTTYYISGNYMDHEGITIASGLERYTIRTNVETKVNDWLKTGVRISGGTDTRETFPYGTNELRGSLGALLNEPYYTPYDENGNVADFWEGIGSNSNEYVLRMQPGNTKNHQLNGNFYMEINPIRGLKFRSQYGIDFYNRRSTRKMFPSADFAGGVGMRRESSAQMLNQTVTNTAEYNFDINNDHNISVLVGQEGTKFDYDFFNVEMRGMEDDRLMEFGAGNIADMTNSPEMTSTQYAYLSYFGQANYDYAGKYFLDLSVRNDKSSRFGAKNRSANFWSAGLMWNLTKEDFMNNVSFINDLRLRGSYGTTGNSEGIGNYSHLALVGTDVSYADKTGWRVLAAGNGELGWEEQSKLTVGFASSLFNNKLTLDVDYYVRKTNNMLMSVPQPYTSGFDEIAENIGGIQNNGIDVTLGVTLFQNQDWNIGVVKTFNYNKNKITDLFYGLDEWVVANTGVSYIVGEEISFYMPKWLGVDPEDGLQMWEDPETGEAVKDFNEEQLSQALNGKPRYAPIQGGFSLNASWSKGLSFSADFAYMYDNYLFNNDRFFYENPALFGDMNQSITVLDEWKEPGDQTKFPKFGEAMEFDDRLIEDASFLRLKNISIAYDVPTTLLGENNPVKGLRFSLTARNLFTITNYSGLDPEVDSNLTLGQYPNTRQYVASVRVSF